jgi:hypothetical protein
MEPLLVSVQLLTTDSDSVRISAWSGGRLDQRVADATLSGTELVTALTWIFGLEAARQLARSAAVSPDSRSGGNA